MKSTILHKLNTLIESIEGEYGVQFEQELQAETSGSDFLFADLKKVLPNISLLPNNVVDTSKYQEHEIVAALKKMGYDYKKPIGKKLHFFNRKTSISIYLGQQTRQITLQP